MKNLVVKTVVITLVSIVGFVAITFGALCVFTPKTVANVFENLGSKTASVFFYELNYNRTNDINDLIEIIDKTFEDTVTQEKYLNKLITREDFSDYCLLEDSGLQSDKLSTKEYYYGYYVRVLIANGKFENAVSVASQFVSSNGYTKYNPLTVLVNDYLAQLNQTQKDALKLAIENAVCDNQQQVDYKNNDLEKFN